MAEKDATEAPTPKRKRDARLEGRIARSPDLAAWAVVLFGAAMVPSTFERVITISSENLHRVGANVEGGPQLPAILGRALADMLFAMAPLLGGAWVLALAITIAQVGFVITSKPLKPKIERLNPLKNVKKIVGVRGAVELVKQMVKTGIIGFVGWGIVMSVGRGLTSRGPLDLAVGMKEAAASVSQLMRSCAMTALGIALIDYGYQRWRNAKDMRMTRQEIRDETRQSEGDPLVKQRIRSLQREAARRRMLSDVANATAVLVNPTHIAVAIRYKPGKDSAPIIVAKGRGGMATKIREQAAEHRVPIVRAVELARALEKNCEVGDVVPAVLYDAVARVLAFLSRMGRRIQWMGVLDLPPAWSVPIPDIGRRRRVRR